MTNPTTKPLNTNESGVAIEGYDPVSYFDGSPSEGKIFEVDPTNFKVTGDRLFLFYKGEAGDTLPDWNADEASRTANADKHWAEDTYTDAG